MPRRERQLFGKRHLLGTVEPLRRNLECRDALEGRLRERPFNGRILDRHRRRIPAPLDAERKRRWTRLEMRGQGVPQEVVRSRFRRRWRWIDRRHCVLDDVRAEPVRHLTPVRQTEQVAGVLSPPTSARNSWPRHFHGFHPKKNASTRNAGFFAAALANPT